jgi:hypothetical protein
MKSALHMDTLKKLIDRWVAVEDHSSDDTFGLRIEVLALAHEGLHYIARKTEPTGYRLAHPPNSPRPRFRPKPPAVRR